MVTTIYLIAAKMMVQFVGDPASLLDNSLKIHNGKNMIGIPKYQRGGGGWVFSSAIFAPQNELKRRRKFLFWERVQLAIYVRARVVAQLHQRFKINVCRYFFHHSSAACFGASLLRIFFKKRRFSSPQTHTFQVIYTLFQI